MHSQTQNNVISLELRRKIRVDIRIIKWYYSNIREVLVIMTENPITIIDGTKEERTRLLKEFLGLRPDQPFQELDVDEIEDDDNDN